MSQRIIAKYFIETAYPLEEATRMLAGEQSSGTFVKIPGETADLQERHTARVEAIEELDTVTLPSLPGARQPNGNPIRQATVTISWPQHNVGANLSNLCATVAGNLFELKAFSGLKLLELELPPEFGEAFPGPRFGVAGTRQLTGVEQRPIIGTIIKPSIGLSPETTAERVQLFAEAGLDFIKDDELMGDPPYAPFEQRVDQVMAVINRWADQTGKKLMYAFNISGSIDDMRRRHDYVLKRGGTCIMVSVNWVGLSAVEYIARHSQLPIHGHRNGWGLFSRSPVLGIEFPVYQKVWRLAGVDHLHTNGLRNKFCESDFSVIKAVKACLEPHFNDKRLMPVLSSGQWAGQVEDTYKAVESIDLMYLCGGGIVGHPMGIAAGVQSVQQAWEAALAGVSAAKFAQTHPELQKALEFYG